MKTKPDDWRAKGIRRHSTARCLQGAGLVLALCLAAWGGARWQAWRAPQPDAVLRLAHDIQRLEDAAALQGSITGLAGKVGELQGRVLAMDALRERIAQAAGLSYSAPELAALSMTPVAGLHPEADPAQVLDDLDAEPLDMAGSAQALGRHIDFLGAQLDRQEDAYALLDAALSRQAGFQASLPTLAPVDYPALSSSFGWRRNPVSGRRSMHEGLDFVAPRGTPIRAASGGLVVRAGTMRGYGKMVEIDHGNGLRTRYAHASSLQVKTGDIVRQGDQIARVGSTGRSTGSHLHFEIRMADYPLDPTLFIQPGAATRRADAPVRLADAEPVKATDPQLR
ncbi:M23 family metallopeptidase [Castellaniella hirudinis]|uniref:M23 family metallopeptidase n=1 Tax=Castellaniella hirudinis TaxID=1144617 RepID=UPI0039C245C2